MPSKLPAEHIFESRLTWTGSVAGGTTSYESYSRELRVDIEGKPSISMSGAAAFRGDPKLHNPEDMLVMALSTCHCLSYLALAARKRLVVVGYEDRATGVLAKIDGKMRFREATLRPEVWLAPGSDEALAKALHEQAHAECFIASSVNFPVHSEPVIRIRG
jgi:organic hydroperoxide reductase OsmC/OhrA